MKTAAIMAITLLAAQPFTASADGVGGPVELNAAGLDYVTAGFSSVMPSTTSLAQKALASVLGESAAPGFGTLLSIHGDPSSSQNSGDGEDSQNEGGSLSRSEEALANFLNGSGPSSNATASPETASPETASPSSSTPVIVTVPAAQREYIRNIPGTGLSVIEPIARGGQNRDFVHHQIQNQR
jgi:hypothetical protein